VVLLGNSALFIHEDLKLEVKCKNMSVSTNIILILMDATKTMLNFELLGRIHSEKLALQNT
jgi:hypothetical protein